MDLNLEKFLLKMNFTKSEIIDMKSLAPTLDVTTLSEVKEVMQVLSQYGYPIEDLPELFYQNPNIMTMSKESLTQELEGLISKNIDIEEYLKNDPFGI